MANQKHLEILKKGVRAWNEWTTQNPRIKPDLSQADLRQANLRAANLSQANLREAGLSAATLIGVDLRGANLVRAKLRGAELGWADLIRADLVGAKLRGADLSEATLIEVDLRGANLVEAKLRGADLADSVMGDTSIGDVDLSGVKGLETVSHFGPSSIGIDTIYRSHGNIPEVFLREAGVPEPFIREMKALVNAMEPIQFYSCFLSYSSKDQEFADRLHADLQQKHVRCWFAPEDLKIGDRFRERIDEAVRLYDKLLLVLSDSSIESPWVEDEVEAALEKERLQKRLVLFPIRLDDAVMTSPKAWAARVRRILHMGDFCGWKEHYKYKKAFERLMRDLRAEDSPDGKVHRAGNPSG